MPVAVASSDAKPKSSFAFGGAAGASISRQFLMKAGLGGCFMCVSERDRALRSREILEASRPYADAAEAEPSPAGVRHLGARCRSSGRADAAGSRFRPQAARWRR